MTYGHLLVLLPRQHGIQLPRLHIKLTCLADETDRHDKEVKPDVKNRKKTILNQRRDKMDSLISDCQKDKLLRNTELHLKV